MAMLSSTGYKDNGILLSVVVPSLSPENCVGLIENMGTIGSEFVFVVKDRNAYNNLLTLHDRVRIVETKARNFSFLRNIGGYYSSGKFILFTGDDERADESLINSLNKFNEKCDAFKITVRALFSGQPITMWGRDNVRMMRREFYHFIAMVHERFSYIPSNTCKLEGKLINNSYDNWHHFWSKSMRITLLEKKTLEKVVLRTYFPILDYIFKGGVKGGFKELKVIIGSMMYAFLICVRGVRPMKPVKLGLEGVESFIIDYAKNQANPEESEYILHVMGNLKKGNVPLGSSMDEEIEQLLTSIDDIGEAVKGKLRSEVRT